MPRKSAAAPAQSQADAGSQDAVLSLDEAVKFLNTSKPTLYRLLRQGDIKALKTGRQWRFRKADLVAYMERSPTASDAPKEVVAAELAYFGQQSPHAGASGMGVGDKETAIGQLAGAIVEHALRNRASDIHMEGLLEASERTLLIRERIDGVLHDVRRMPAALHDALFEQFKSAAEMNPAEKRIPQSGRISLSWQDSDYYLRLATIPTVVGEALTMRVLNRSGVLMGLDRLGLSPEDIAHIHNALSQPKGMIITTGPTGSGKTTLLYSCLQHLADGRIKVCSVEDPVEYQLPYVTQTPINRKLGVNYPEALRTVLRSDPDVVMSAEVRDLETAELLTELALTGHLVLTSLHPNAPAEAFRRLIDMGVMPFLVAETVICVIGQRLVRRICPACKAPDTRTEARERIEQLRRIALLGGYEVPRDAEFFTGSGCGECRGTGYRGRTGLFSVIPVTPVLSSAIVRGASSEEIAQLARGSSPGARSLAADGARKAVEGITTVDDVLRAVPIG